MIFKFFRWFCRKTLDSTDTIQTPTKSTTDTPPTNDKKSVEKPRFGSIELPSYNSVSEPPPGLTQGKPRPPKSD